VKTERLLIPITLAATIVWLAPSGLPWAVRTAAGFMVGAGLFAWWMLVRSNRRQPTQAPAATSRPRRGPVRSSDAVLLRWAIMATLLAALAVALNHPFAYQLYPFLVVVKRGANPVVSESTLRRFRRWVLQAICVIAIVAPAARLFTAGAEAIPAPPATTVTLIVGALALVVAFGADPLARRVFPACEVSGVRI
jgi:hypothetical protein